MTLLIISPLILSIFLLSVSMVTALKHHTKLYSLCYQTGIQTQRSLKTKIQNLFKLNSKAQALRLQRKASKALLYAAIVSGIPIAISKARSQVKKVKLQQKAIRVAQKQILLQGRMIIQKNWIYYKLKSQRWIQNPHKKQIQSPLAVIAFPKRSDSPSYKLADSFEQKQNIKISWRMNIFKFIPSWVRLALNLNSYSKHNCSVSLKEENKNLNIQLMKSNSF